MWIVDYIIDIFTLIILVFGPFGNILVFKIYSTPTMSKTSLSIYFRAMSINDTVNLVNLLVPFLIQQFNIDPSQSVSFLCHMENYFSYLQTPITAWLMVVISLDRFFNVAYPRQFPLISRKTFQLTLTFAIIIFQCIYYSMISWNTYLVPVYDLNNTQARNRTVCLWNFDVTLMGWMDFVNSTALPFILMILLSSMVIVSLVRSRAKVNNLSSSSPQTLKLSQRDRKFAITILSLNFIFLLLNLPVEIYDLFVPVSNLNRVYYFLVMLYYAHAGSSFYVQVAVNSLFRWEFLRIIRPNSSAVEPYGGDLSRHSI